MSASQLRSSRSARPNWPIPSSASRRRSAIPANSAISSGSQRHSACPPRPSGSRTTVRKELPPRPRRAIRRRTGRPTAAGTSTRRWSTRTLEESRFRNTVRSPAGAYGLMQIMPAAATRLCARTRHVDRPQGADQAVD
ncbi:transglycosylase SLT domain-containing protein [Sphingomonas aerolata]|uniref:transglycosylase SLT domain-containing protein n=1 Tax=Sphingomonas aerolata TaxID=185951 RepID=UPI002FE3EDE7